MDIQETLLTYLEGVRTSLLSKLDGLDEVEARLPRTMSGTSLAGLVKHCCFIEHGYLVACLGRDEVPGVGEDDWDTDPNADLYLGSDETVAGVLVQYEAVAAAVRAAITELPLDAPAHVPWWGEKADTTLGRLLVHVTAEVAQHTGHADILREGIDGVVGLKSPGNNVWEPADGWAAHVSRLEALAKG